MRKTYNLRKKFKKCLNCIKLKMDLFNLLSKNLFKFKKKIRIIKQLNLEILNYFKLFHNFVLMERIQGHHNIQVLEKFLGKRKNIQKCKKGQVILFLKKNFKLLKFLSKNPFKFKKKIRKIKQIKKSKQRNIK